MKAKIFLFLLGGLLGFLVAALFQPLLRPLVGEAFRGEEDVTEGRVVGKRLQGERLLLTVDAAEGTVLATFKQRVPEIDMLVEEGDLLKLGVARYEPFVEDPPILAVRKQELSPPRRLRPDQVGEPRPERPATGIIPRADEEEPAPGRPAEREPRPEERPDDEGAEPPPPEQAEGQVTPPEPDPPPAPPPAPR